MFTITRDSALAPDEVWRRLSDLKAHSAGVPLTSTTADPGDPHVGWGFTARTAVGPVHFDDSMVVEAWDPPTRWRIRKTGALGGWAELTVTPHGAGSRVVWTEELGLRVRRLARISTMVGDRVGPLLFGTVLDGLLRDRE